MPGAVPVTSTRRSPTRRCPTSRAGRPRASHARAGAPTRLPRRLNVAAGQLTRSRSPATGPRGPPPEEALAACPPPPSRRRAGGPDAVLACVEEASSGYAPGLTRATGKEGSVAPQGSTEGAAAAPTATAARRGQTRDEHALEEILEALTAARDGDFTTRLRARRSDLIGELQARTNELLDLNARMARELQRVAPRDRPRGPDDRARLARPGRRGALGRERRVGQLAHRRPRPPDHRGRARHRGGRRRRPLPEDGADDRGPAGQGRVRRASAPR